MLRISNLSISFQGNPVLRNINATLSAGSRTGIVGPNGCGKTTLLKAIVGSAGRDVHLREASYPDSHRKD
ncbi:MAG: ABC transporter ATP-binding protein [Candidatus Fermentithermobacillus carboniphilus]|uniref:ABC transporter ATP-binding protein n=1 Tax=Candidatus Fermentithermobacillus carboniphilus TaxID=3085328 RepID=A0AAT9LEN2_9FIRM|nr:MAG: ABC transporter ATP-binding protein [Candidatus Fermentithermobacillus carboniphilus]